jgi:fructan beta-fructosidase
LVAIYTAHRPGNQSQAIAYSNDRGRTWTKYSQNPVIDLGEADFRDPKVFWHEATGAWVMTVSLAAKKRVQFYGSSDLKHWKLLSEFGPAGAPDAPNWECPDLFQAPIEGQAGKTKWVLHISVGGNAANGGSGCQYFVGEFDGKTFTPDGPTDEARWVDFGRDFYAAVTWSDIPKADGRRLWIGWMSNWEASRLPTSPWRGAMTLPRSLALRPTGQELRLIQKPVDELQELRGSHVHLQDQTLLSDARLELSETNGFGGDAIELVANFAVGDAREVGLEVRCGGEQATRVGYDVRQQRVFVDRTKSGKVDFHPSFAGRHGGPLKLLEGGRIKLHVFVDRSSVEVFANDGETVLTELVFPDLSSGVVRVYAEGGAAKLISLDGWQLRSIWH